MPRSGSTWDEEAPIVQTEDWADKDSPTPLRLISFQEMPVQRLIVHPGQDKRAESTNQLWPQSLSLFTGA